MDHRTALFVSTLLPAALGLAGCESQGGAQPAPDRRGGAESERAAPSDESADGAQKEGDDMNETPDARADAAEPLERHAWEHRPVVVFAASAESDTYDRQREIFQSRQEGLRDRDIVVYRVFEDGGVRGPDGERSREVGRALRERFQPDGPFAVILVGKDTTEKLRTADVLTADKLFETIDAMPMRQREMRSDD